MAKEAIKAYETIILERDGDLATLTLNRPEKLNATTDQMFIDIHDALRTLYADESLLVLIVTGAGRGFCAGADIGERQLSWAEDLRSKPRRVIPEYRVERNHDIQYLMRDLPQVAIASVNGPAIGFGNCLQVVCDLRIASDKATFGHQFVRMGLTPGIGSTWKLPRVVGLPKAAEMMFTGKIYNAQEAKEMGLVNWVVAHDKLQEETDKLARLIAGHPPIALRAAKLLLSYSMENDLPSQVLLERWAALTHETNDHLEAVKAFLEKRKPVFTGE